MAYSQSMGRILQKDSLAANIYRFVVFCEDIAQEAVPGQFVHILPNGFSLRRPISICAIDSQKATFTIVFEAKGAGTKALSELCVGDNIDVLGPLGKGFTLLSPQKRVILVGGGIGNPPMLSLAQVYHENATAICGFRSAAAVILQKELQQTGAQTILCTDDGTMGRHGFVTEPLRELLINEKYEMVYACGPRPMLKFVAAAAKAAGVPCEVSMEERMGCGIGACLICACALEQEGKPVMGHVCKDGPVFRAEEVIW